MRIIRGLATGEVDPRPTQRTRSIVSDELLRAAVLAFILLVVAGLMNKYRRISANLGVQVLAFILVVAGFVRVVAFDATLAAL